MNKKRVSFETFEDYCIENKFYGLTYWIKDYFPNEYNDKIIYYLPNEIEKNENKFRVSLSLFSKEHELTIVIKRPKDHLIDSGYIGGFSSERKLLAGGTHIEGYGCDLHDGNYSKETFLGVFIDFLKRIEFEKVVPYGEMYFYNIGNIPPKNVEEKIKEIVDTIKIN